MITGEIKNKIDQLWTQFWTGGVTNPFTVIEQITFLMFSRLLDIKETVNENKSKLSGHPFKKIFSPNEQHIRWESFRHLEAEEMLKVVRDEVFPHFKRAFSNGSTLSEYMKDAQLMVVRPSLLVTAVNTIYELPLTEGDTKGDLYEYLLSKLQTSGIAGQFRTPRHIIEMMVKIIDPQPTDLICDPACGTAGFLVGVMEYLNKNNMEVYPGDKLFDYQDHIQNKLLNGFDFDSTMLRIAAMNLLLHNIDSPQIHNQDSLSGTFLEKFPQLAENYYTVILANPPFKGSLDNENVESSLVGKVKTKKTELLFNFLFLRMLKLGGRAAIIVPDGALFGASKAHVALRQTLIEENQLEAIISLPSGVFKPYAGVSTAIMVFTKGGKTENIWFYDVEADGLSLDDKRQPVPENDLPDVVDSWKKRNEEDNSDKSKKHFFVSVDDIRKNKYDLSISKYKEIVYKEIEYEKPQIILEKMFTLEDEIRNEMNKLKEMLPH
ncbi:MAG: class I SAM-dependent DNA methyltransferase [Ignavibacteriaceae bacterium]